MSLRLFLALEPPESVLGEARRAVDHLRRALPGLRARYPELASTHLTLLFLGQVAPADADLVERRAGAVVRAHAAFRVSTAGLGAFPTPWRPSVLWLGIDDDRARLAALQAELALALAPLLTQPTGPRFVPHLTLARVAGLGETPRQQVTAALEAFRESSAAWPVTEVVLYRSHLHPEGARYQALVRWPLRAAPPDG